MSVVKSLGPTQEWLPKLTGWRHLEVTGTLGGAVKCVDIKRNAGGEDGSLEMS